MVDRWGCSRSDVIRMLLRNEYELIIRENSNGITLSEKEESFLDFLGDRWGCSRSDAFKTLIRSEYELILREPSSNLNDNENS